MLLDEIKPTTVVSHRIDIRGGTIAICEILPHKVIFMIIGLYTYGPPTYFPGDSSDTVTALREKFGECETIESISLQDAFIFSRSLEEPLQDPRSFLLSTQRKVIEIIDEVERNTIRWSVD